MLSWRIRYGLLLLLSLHAGPGMCADIARAESALALLPDDTLGFVWIRNMEDADAKITAWKQQFGVPLPAPMKFLKFATGLGAGIDGQHDLVVALLAPATGSRDYQPIVLLPVADYEKLAASVRGDDTGEICRVTIRGENVLVAHNRSHAMLMNVEHRATMVRLLARQPKLLETVRPIHSWLAANDMVVSVSPKSMEGRFSLERQRVGQNQQQFEQNIEQAPWQGLVTQVRQAFEIYRTVLDATNAQVKSSTLGLTLDNHSNLKVGVRLVLAKTSQFAQFRFTPLARRQLATGGQAGAYVAAVTGTLSKGWGELIAKSSRRLLQRFPDLEGYGEFEQEDWEKVEQSYRATTAGVQTFSLLMRVPREDEPLLSGIYGVVQVENADDYLASYQQALTLNNELVERSSSDIKLKNKFFRVTVADTKGLKVVADIAAATGDHNNPFWQATLNDLFGEGGKLKMHLLATDETHVILSTAEEENLVQFVRDIQAGNWQGQAARNDDSSLQKTLQLVDEHSPWIAVVSPRGSVQWLTRWLKALMIQLGEAPQIPPFPATPPIGFTFALVEAHCKVDLVLPVETLKGMAKFIQTVQ